MVTEYEQYGPWIWIWIPFLPKMRVARMARRPTCQGWWYIKEWMNRSEREREGEREMGIMKSRSLIEGDRVMAWCFESLQVRDLFYVLFRNVRSKNVPIRHALRKKERQASKKRVACLTMLRFFFTFFTRGVYCLHVMATIASTGYFFRLSIVLGLGLRSGVKRQERVRRRA